MLSAVFFMNRKGEILISRVYRDDVKFVTLAHSTAHHSTR